MRQPIATFDEDRTRSDMYDEDIGGPMELGEGEMSPEAFDEEFLPEGGEGFEGDQESMTEEELHAVTMQEIQASGGLYDEVSQIRERALEMYAGHMPSAPQGRSQAVSQDVADVIEWTLPQVMTALMENSNVVSFDPLSEDDEEQAQLETDAVEHVLYQENDGFLYVYSACKDALIQRNGIGKIYWDESTEVCFESYSGLTEPEVMQLLEPSDGSVVTPIAYDQRAMDGVVDFNAAAQQQPQPQQPGMPQQQQPQQPLTVYDIEVKRVTSAKGVRIEPLAPEEFRWNRDHNSITLDGARFTDHNRRVTRQDLLAEGWPEDLVDTLPADATLSDEQETRFESDGEYVDQTSTVSSGTSVIVHECYLLIDADRDGVPEYMKVHVAGEGGEVFMGSEAVNGNPFVGTTAILMTHKFLGHSLWDRVRGIQEQKTELVRQIQDNLKHQNNSRLLVVAGQVNLDDMLTSRPGGIVRQKQPGMVEPLVAPQIGELGYKHLEYLDNVRTGRSGVSPDTASVANAIAGDTAHGLERLMTAKEELTGLMIRLFANTLIKGTMRKTRALLQQHRDTAMHFKVRGKWQEVNPADWTTRTGATVSPALSQGDRVKRAQALQVVLQQQQNAVEAGALGTMVTEGNIYNALTDFVRTSPLGDPSPYWQDPESQEAQAYRKQAQEQAEKDKAEAAAQAEKAQAMVLQTQAAIEQAKDLTRRLDIVSKESQAQSKAILDYQKSQEDLEKQYTELELKYNTDIAGVGLPSTDTGAGPSPAGGL